MFKVEHIREKLPEGRNLRGREKAAIAKVHEPSDFVLKRPLALSLTKGFLN